MRYLASAASAAALLAAALALAQPAEPLPAKLVHITADNIPLRAALDQLHQQTGMRFSLGSLDNQPITLNVQDQPLWSTLQAVMTRLAPPDDFSLTISDDNAAGPGPTSWRLAGRASISGPFLIIAQSITHDIDYRRPPADLERYTINLLLATDGSVHIASLSDAIHLDKALDESGAAFATPAPTPLPGPVAPVRPPLLNRASPLAPFPIPLSLTAASPASARIQLLQGAIPATLISKPETLEFPVPGTLEKDYDSFHLTCDVAPSLTGCTINAAFTRAPAVSDEQWTVLRSELQGARLLLLDAHGTPIANNGSGGGSGPDRITRNARFNTAGAKARLEFPLNSHPVNIPFHFENLPLR